MTYTILRMSRIRVRHTAHLWCIRAGNVTRS